MTSGLGDHTQYKKLVLSLVRADTEQEVEQILGEFDLWEDNDTNWQVIDEGHQNYSTIGNQQDSPDVALTEKIVNAIDAVMISRCWEKGIDPESDQAPQTIAEAQKEFFDIYNGALSTIDPPQRSELSKDIMLVATGDRYRPSYTIIDKGEGQSPHSFEDTFLSLNRGNKNKIQFVQGKFGMGGTGVLAFGSPNHNIQLIISKRNPRLTQGEHDHCWGATIIRRRPPTGNMRSSEYTYLAPNKKIIAFDSEALPLLPGAYPNAYKEGLEYGSCIKLYEYQINSSLSSYINLSFYYRFSLLLPNIALPIRLYERRKMLRGHEHHTILVGLGVRLDEDKRSNLEFPEPFSGNINIKGETVGYRIYVFRQGKRRSYTKNDGVIFSLDGKLHGKFSQTFFRRRSVGMSYLADSILVIVDCSKVSGAMREKLFMNSRDRLRDGEEKKIIERGLEEILSNHPGLKKLREKRIREMSSKKLEDMKPLMDILQTMISKSRSLRNLFQQGGKLKDPYNLNPNKEKNFISKDYPTYFKLVKEFPKHSPKYYPINQRYFRVEYETDACNDYFNRDKDPGNFYFNLNNLVSDSYTLSLYNGKATLTVDMLESVEVGTLLQFESQVTDATRPEPFIEKLFIKVSPEVLSPKPPNGNGKDRERKELDTLNLPKHRSVRKNEWHEHNFDKESALRVVYNGQEYIFYINMDNIHLLTEISSQPDSDKVNILKSRFMYGMIILGLALLKSYQKQEEQQASSTENDNKEELIEDEIFEFTKAIAPALLPMIEGLGGLEITE